MSRLTIVEAQKGWRFRDAKWVILTFRGGPNDGKEAAMPLGYDEYEYYTLDGNDTVAGAPILLYRLGENQVLDYVGETGALL